MKTPQLDSSFRTGLHEMLVDHADAPTSRRRPELFVAGGLGFALLAAAGVAAVVSGALVAPARDAAPTATAQQDTGRSPQSGSGQAARVEIYHDLRDVTADSTIVIVGTAAADQRMRGDYPGLTLTDITITEVLKGDVEISSTITLGDFALPGSPPPTTYTEISSGAVTPGETYLLHLRPFGEYDSVTDPGQVVDGSWIFVSPFPSHYELRGEEFVLMSDWIDDTLPRSIPRADVGGRALGLDVRNY